MELKTCPTCGSQIPEQSTICPNCGQPLAPNTMPQQQQPKSKNNNAIIIALVAVACLAIGALVALLLNRNKTEAPAEPQATEQVTADPAASATVPATSPLPATVPSDVNNGEVIPDVLNEYVVSSYGGYGVYVRTRPNESSKTRKVYRDNTHFMGAPSKKPGYIMIIRNGRVIGYVPEEKVYESGYNDYNDGYPVAQ